jgi:putative transposase
MISESTLPKIVACETLGICRATHYRNKDQKQTTIDLNLKSLIEKIILKFPGYGYRRVTKHMHRQGVSVNHKKVLKAMQMHNLVCKRKKFSIICQYTITLQKG